ncbi:hypothetical protein ACOSP7_021405 [Xanthoceras sorbifolium]
MDFNMFSIIPTQAIELGTFECVKQAMTSEQEKWIDCESRYASHFKHCNQQDYKDGGIGAFYASISLTLIGMIPHSTYYYFMYETKSLNHPEMLMVGAIAGLTASTVSFPWKLPEKRLMVGEHCKGRVCKLFKSDAPLWHNLDVL